MLERVGLAHLMDRHPTALSGGQRQRVALAHALVVKPQVLLMEEPLSNLDAKLRIQIRETISEIQRELNITIVFVTHDQEETLSMSDMIGVMNKGKVEQLGTPQEIYATPVTSYFADFVRAANLVKVKMQAKKDGQIIVTLGDLSLWAVDALTENTQECILILRPEDLQVSLTPIDGKQSIPAIVKSKQYLGSKTSYRMRILNDHEVIAEINGNRHDAFVVGQSVSLDINPQLARVIVS